MSLDKKLIPFNELQTSILVDYQVKKHHKRTLQQKVVTTGVDQNIINNVYSEWSSKVPPSLLKENPSVWSYCANKRRGVKTGVHYIASHIFRPQNQTRTIWKWAGTLEYHFPTIPGSLLQCLSLRTMNLCKNKNKGMSSDLNCFPANQKKPVEGLGCPSH
jgi:hypothetical protein